MTTPLRKVVAWHRPLMLSTYAMAALAVFCLAAVVADDRTLLGVPIWLKPFKFAISFVFYGGTLAWMLSLLPRRSRTAEWMGTGIVALLLIEMVIIVGQVVRGRASHFNASTELDGRLFSIMGAAISLLFLLHLVVAVVLARQPLGDRALTRGIRLGLFVSLLGMAAAVPMVLPSAAVSETVTGAHSVGVADGGPGLPVTGWSLTGGDLRVGHFIGLHALQALPLLAWGLGWLARRGRSRLDALARVRLVTIGGIGYAVLTVMLTVQALRGQPLLRPDLLTAAGFVLLLAGAAAAVAYTVTRPAVQRRSANTEKSGSYAR